MVTTYLKREMASAISTVKLFHFDQNPDSKYVKFEINFVRRFFTISLRVAVSHPRVSHP